MTACFLTAIFLNRYQAISMGEPVYLRMVANVTRSPPSHQFTISAFDSADLEFPLLSFYVQERPDPQTVPLLYDDDIGPHNDVIVPSNGACSTLYRVNGNNLARIIRQYLQFTGTLRIPTLRQFQNLLRRSHVIQGIPTAIVEERGVLRYAAVRRAIAATQQLVSFCDAVYF
jgi:hypothetical protein